MRTHVCVGPAPGGAEGKRGGRPRQATSRTPEGLPTRPTCYPKAMICLPRVQPQGPGVPGCPRDNDSVAYQPLPGPA